MRRNIALIILLGLILALVVSTALGQQSGSSAAATEATASSGRPSTIQIRQQILQQQQAIIEGDLREVQRCIKNSRLSVVLMDPEGRINRVPQADLVNCGRRLRQLQRQIASLARRSLELARDAQFRATLLEQALREQEREERFRALESTGGEPE